MTASNLEHFRNMPPELQDITKGFLEESMLRQAAHTASLRTVELSEVPEPAAEVPTIGAPIVPAEATAA